MQALQAGPVRAYSSIAAPARRYSWHQRGSAGASHRHIARATGDQRGGSAKETLNALDSMLGTTTAGTRPRRQRALPPYRA